MRGAGGSDGVSHFLEYRPDERVVRAAVDFLVNRMADPEYNQLGRGGPRDRADEKSKTREAFSQALVSDICSRTPAAILDGFRGEAVRMMLTRHPFKDYDLESMVPLPRTIHMDGRVEEHPARKAESIDWLRRQEWIRRFSCDYGPCSEFAMIAQRVGLPHHHFPIKSDFSLYAPEREGGLDYFCHSFGYGVPQTYCYPLGSGAWLCTSLTGGADDLRTLMGLAADYPALGVREAP